MDGKTMRRICLLLIAVSIVIYGLQILIFRDHQTTFFYILQDLAFMPVTIAIATLVVGELMNNKEKKERMVKTRMLTSTFYTEFGGQLMGLLLTGVQNAEELQAQKYLQAKTEDEVKELQKKIREQEIIYRLDQNIYDTAMELITAHKEKMLILAASPMLEDHESFTKLLWGIFHLMDEYRLRGSYKNLSAHSIEHMSEDMGRLTKELIYNAIANALYLRQTYPEYYRQVQKITQG